MTEHEIPEEPRPKPKRRRRKAAPPPEVVEEARKLVENPHPTEPEPETEPDPTPRPEPAPPGGPSAADVLNLVSRLPSTEQEKLARIGAVFPMGAEDDPSHVTCRFAYKCAWCHEPAMLLLGTRWPDGQGGFTNIPPAHLSIDQIAWAFPKDTANPNRRDPLCPSCGAAVTLGVNRTLMPEHIVPIDQWRAVLDKAYNRYSRVGDLVYNGARVLGPGEVANRIRTLEADMQGSSQSFDGKISRPGDALDPQARADIEAIADATNLTEGLAKDLGVE